MQVIILRVVNITRNQNKNVDVKWYKRHKLGDEASLENLIPLGSRLRSVSA